MKPSGLITLVFLVLVVAFPVLLIIASAVTGQWIGVGAGVVILWAEFQFGAHITGGMSGQELMDESSKNYAKMLWFANRRTDLAYKARGEKGEALKAIWGEIARLDAEEKAWRATIDDTRTDGFMVRK